MSDRLVRGGRVVDGSGAPPARADVLIRRGRIDAVEPPGRIPADAAPTIDASGLVVAPGFIDVHSHADNAPLLADDDTSKILQGVTTEVVGNCGESLAPASTLAPESFAAFADRTFPPLDVTWSSWSEFTERTDALGYVTNYAPLVGHGPLRIAVLGLDDRAPDADELTLMRRELDKALDGGAFGMSSGLIYPPGIFSDTGELIALARQLGPDGLYVTHLRNEGSQLLNSIREADRIGRTARCRVHISHLKARGRDNWGRMPLALDLVKELGSDRPLTKDIYPYTAGSTVLTAMLPPHFLTGGNDAVLGRLSSPERRRELAHAMEHGIDGWESHLHAAGGWDNVMVSSTHSHRHEGRTLTEIAADLELSPVDALIRVLTEERLRATMVLFVMDPGDVRDAFADPDTMVGSDGLPPGGGGKPHPRAFGTFPRILAEYVRTEKLMELGEAVRRMTSLPAEVFRIPERGLVRRGYVADLVAFDPDHVDHVCDYRDPVRAPAGIGWVMQAGAITVEGSHYIGPRRGVRLRPA
ncbi:N-acyl-D-amino-acid deacylase family protein [Jiangella endophytica]|uniref:N-acyl-D-amino-acid deacylase family protein n=1 Tax=Jiangella endophytica TaxID=1623398 RepID=UPI000E353282|nr:amidohydrolase family protein [Jiangella endophytica]